MAHAHNFLLDPEALALGGSARLIAGKTEVRIRTGIWNFEEAVIDLSEQPAALAAAAMDTLKAIAAESAANAENAGAAWATENDPRVTRVGRFIRRTRLDELPQLWNVLTGSMSLVGPRPERPMFIERLEKEIPFFRQRLFVKPGVTGHAQVRSRYASSTEDHLEKLSYDLFYIKSQSLWFDLSILIDTVKVVLLRMGAR